MMKITELLFESGQRHASPVVEVSRVSTEDFLAANQET